MYIWIVRAKYNNREIEYKSIGNNAYEAERNFKKLIKCNEIIKVKPEGRYTHK